MRDLSAALLREYPGMNMFGEIWEHSVPIQSFFAGKTSARKDFDTRLPSVIDFQIYKAINEALTKPFSWNRAGAMWLPHLYCIFTASVFTALAACMLRAQERPAALA
jgi:hypothetical protein